MTFTQLMPTPLDHWQNELGLTTQDKRNVRFNGKAYKARWSLELGFDDEWDTVNIAFSRQNKVESPSTHGGRRGTIALA